LLIAGEVESPVGTYLSQSEWEAACLYQMYQFELDQSAGDASRVEHLWNNMASLQEEFARRFPRQENRNALKGKHNSATSDSPSVDPWPSAFLTVFLFNLTKSITKKTKK